MIRTSLLRLSLFASTLLFVCEVPTAVASPIATSYTVDTGLFKNPERGLYVSVKSHRTSTDATSPSEWRWVVNNPDSITLVYEEFVLHDFRSSRISEAYLDMMRKEFLNLRRHGLKAIVRFCYITSSDWNGGVDDDTLGANLEWILTHIEQIQPVIGANIDVIAFFQAGFIGRWGEWGGGVGTQSVAYPDYSRDKAAQAAVLGALLAAVPSNRMVDVRYPRGKIEYLNDETPMTIADWWSGGAKGRIGHHNDAFHRNAHNSGTFYDWGKHDTSWFRAWYRAETKFGGSCSEQNGLWTDRFDLSWFPDSNGWYRSVVHAVGRESAEMANQHVVAIGSSFHPYWIGGMKSRGLWDNLSLGLGYRLALLSSELPATVASGGSLPLKLILTNTGSSSLRNPRGIELVLRRDSDGTETTINLFRHKHPQLDPRLWWAGDTIRVDTTLTLPKGMNGGVYSVFLNLPDTCAQLHDVPHYSIRLASQGVWESSTGYNDLLADVMVTEAPTSTDCEPGGCGDPDDVVPRGFSLEQNYPNPFNPKTTIRYQLPKVSRVRLMIYDMLGREVLTLVDDLQEPGYKSVELDASPLSSGVYLCLLQASDFVQTRRLVLLK